MFLSALLAAVGFVPAVRVQAQTFTTLHHFDGFQGAYPRAGLIRSNNTLYGTASNGGGSGPGEVFAMQPDGAGFTNLHGLTVSDGAQPHAGLILAGDTLYGTTSGLGNYDTNGNGTVFAIKTNGTGYRTLHSFTALDPTYYTNSDGKSPRGSLILSHGTLYGTAAYGGASANGTVFALNTNGTGFTLLHAFTPLAPLDENYYTNSDGAHPFAELMLSGNVLFGTAEQGGASGLGTVFSLHCHSRN